MKNILVTGGAGFIGGELSRYLLSEGAALMACRRSNSEGAAGSARSPLTMRDVVMAADGSTPHVIIHAAGSGTVGKVAADPGPEISSNLASLLNVLEYARLHAPDAQVVLLSSAALYGDAPAEPQREEQSRSPVSLYGLAKAQAEQLAAFYAKEYGVRTTAIRLFSVYGPGLRKQLLWDAMNKFSSGSPVFFGTGLERRDWIHIDDVCRFVARLIAVPATSAFEVMNCASGQVASTSEVLSHMATLLGAEPPLFNGQTRRGDPSCLVADCSKSRQLLDWTAEVTWPVGIAAYVKWFRSSASRSGSGQ